MVSRSPHPTAYPRSRRLNHYQIVGSVNKYIEDNWDTDIEWWDPARWDEIDDSKITWATVQVQILGEPPTRIANLRQADLRVIVRVYCRSTTDLYGSLREASDIGTLLRHAAIEVTDGSTDLGLVTLHEPTITQETDEGRPKWQIHQMVIEGDAQAT